jgi:signal transduction histidine kinase
MDVEVGSRAKTLISDLLESERLAQGHRALQRESCSLNALVREVVEERFASARLQLRLESDLLEAPLDPVRLRLLLRNLIDNALRHGGAAATEPLVCTAQVHGRLRLVVRDFGPGIEEAQLSRLGEAFHRPDAARQRRTGGVGLGLYLCRAVARAHGGELRFRNAGPGLEATLDLPT